MNKEERLPERKALIVGCLFVYVFLAVVAFWPAVPWNSTRLPSTPFGGNGYGDPAQMTWFLAWVPYAITHGLSIFHTNFIDYPTGVDLANGNPSTLLGLLGLPITLTLGPVATFNILLRLAFATSSASMFLVLRNWCRWPLAFVGGFLYGFGPYMVSQGQTHLNLMFVPLPPIMVWVLYDLVMAKRHRPVRMGCLLGLLAGLQVLIEPELLALLSIVVGVGLVALAIIDHRRLRWRFDNLMKAVLPAAALFLAVAGYLIWSMMFASGHLVGPALPATTLERLRGDLFGPIVPTLNQLVLPRSLIPTAAKYIAGNFSENSTYLGIPLVTLVAVFGIRWRRDRVVLTSSLLCLVAFIFSLGSRLTVNGHIFNIPLPGSLFVHAAFLDNIVPSRFSFVVELFAVMTVAIGAEHYISALSEKNNKVLSRRVGDVLVAVLLVGAVIVVLPSVPLTTKSPNWPPGVDQTLDDIPQGSTVLTYPFTTSTYTEAMSWQAADAMRFRIIGGYATVQGGADSGLFYQPLLGQPFIQEYLLDAQYGHPYLYPAPSTAENPATALCAFIRTYRVGALVYWDSGTFPLRVKQLFTLVLGTPSHTTKDRKVLVWITKNHSCTRSPTNRG